MHLKTIDDFKAEMDIKNDKNFQDKITVGRQQQQTQVGKELLKEVDLFDYRKINYLQTHKKNINFSYLQSMCLIAAYLSGANKEAMDSRIFTKQQHKKMK